MTATPDPSTGQQTFVAAMQTTQAWLAAWEAGELSDEVLADRVGDLVAGLDGARGFFVVALTGETPLLDRLSEPLLLALRRNGALVVDLTARNLAMSTAMALQHGRSGDAEQQAASLRVQGRCRELLRQLEPVAVKARLEPLLAAAAGGATADAPAATPADAADRAFLERWGYDAEQKQAIAAAIEAVAEG
jgi:hypothetical protein